MEDYISIFSRISCSLFYTVIIAYKIINDESVIYSNTEKYKARQIRLLFTKGIKQEKMRIADKIIIDSLPDQPHKNLKTFQMKQFLEVVTILQIIFLKLYGYEW